MTDIVAIVCMAVAIVTGFVLHKEIHHIFVYDDTLLWTIHEVAGLVWAVCVAMHCVQHKAWFKKYRNIPAARKRVTTILLAAIGLAAVSGVVLMCGSHSQFVSIFHCILAILVTLIAIGHVAKRRKIFKALFN